VQQLSQHNQKSSVRHYLGNNQLHVWLFEKLISQHLRLASNWVRLQRQLSLQLVHEHNIPSLRQRPHLPTLPSVQHVFSLRYPCAHVRYARSFQSIRFKFLQQLEIRSLECIANEVMDHCTCCNRLFIVGYQFSGVCYF